MRWIARALALLFFAMLLSYPQTAAGSAMEGLKICGELIIPSLFPFFIAGGLLKHTGVIALLSEVLSPLCSRLFSCSGLGGSAFILGICTGYPVGAKLISDCLSEGSIEKSEAERILCFCNNSGPAFIIAAVGIGVFGSLWLGLLLYAMHTLSSLVFGVLSSVKSEGRAGIKAREIKTLPFTRAFTLSVSDAAASCIGICGFVICFTVLSSILREAGLILSASYYFCTLLGVSMHFAESLCSGIFELGCGIAALKGLPAGPETLSLASFLLSWGGISVHFQTLSLFENADIKAARYILGRLVIAVISAFGSYAAALLFKI